VLSDETNVRVLKFYANYAQNLGLVLGLLAPIFTNFKGISGENLIEINQSKENLSLKSLGVVQCKRFK
jgi:hypothetical protein